MGKKSASQQSHPSLQESTFPSHWKPFDKYAKRYDKYATHLVDFQRAIREAFERGDSQVEKYTLHRSRVVDMRTIWAQDQDALVPLLLDVPVSKRKLLSKYVETLTTTLPLLDEASKDVAQNMGTLSVYLKDSIKAFKRVASKLDERARWYLAHPEMKCPTLK